MFVLQRRKNYFWHFQYSFWQTQHYRNHTQILIYKYSVATAMESGNTKSTLSLCHVSMSNDVTLDMAPAIFHYRMKYWTEHFRKTQPGLIFLAYSTVLCVCVLASKAIVLHQSETIESHMYRNETHKANITHNEDCPKCQFERKRTTCPYTTKRLLLYCVSC